MSEKFFDEQAEQSGQDGDCRQYFESWARVIQGRWPAKQPKVAYIDLFAGPGRYKDGATLRLSISSRWRSGTPSYATTWSRSSTTRTRRIRAHSSRNQFPSRHRDAAVQAADRHRGGRRGDRQAVRVANLVPSLMFVDPWGYKGLSLRLINSVLKDWACECVFFFNYNRINMGLGNQAVKAHMDALFGEGRPKCGRS